MHIEFLVEERSTQEALQILLPKMLGQGTTFDIHRFHGKHDLLGKLPNLLKGYRQWKEFDRRIVVLIDEDREDCLELKSKLEAIAAEVGFITKTAAAPDQAFQVLNRIAVEELESWFFGDVKAIVAAYPGVPKTLAQKKQYRNPDGIKGGTWEALERVLQEKKHHLGGLEKVRAAREISQHMNPEFNRSPSFQAFWNGLRQMT